MRSARFLPLFIWTFLLCLLLSACGAPSPASSSAASTSSAAETETETIKTADPTLESLCGGDYVSYLTETVLMQMGNRMDKTPEVKYFPITDQAPLSDYVSIDETTAFQVNADGNIVLFFPAGTVTDAEHGEQSFIVPLP